MASIGHVVVGMAAGRCWAGGAPLPRAALPMLAFSALAMLPDADVVAFALGIPYAAPFGHRGASHSLAAALLVGAALALLPAAPGARLRRSALAAAVVASHGLLDALTDGGLGVALLWPVSDARFFAPLRPLPVAPIGARFLSARGLEVAMTEFLFFLPALAYALWPRRLPPPEPRSG